MITQDKGHTAQLHRLAPREVLIDLEAENLDDATYAELTDRAFYRAAGNQIQRGDTIILVHADASTLVLKVGEPDPATGGWNVIDVGRAVVAMRASNVVSFPMAAA